MEIGLTLGGEHTMQYGVSRDCTLETNIILLSNVTTINVIFLKMGKLVYLNPTVSAIPVNVNGLNTPIIRQRISDWIDT